MATSQLVSRDRPTQHGWARPERETWRTVPNLVTVIRTAAAVALGLVAVRTGSTPLLVAGYAVYWVGDILDGLVARRLDQETRIGAVADILCDRLCTVTLCAGLVGALPDKRPAVAVFLVQFVVADLVLSLGALRWPVLSPNYFACIDVPLYRWNWSPPAKAINSAAVVLVAALTGSVVIGVALACAGLVVKLVSLRRMSTLR